MEDYVQLIVEVDGYRPENRDRIVDAVDGILDWVKVRLGKYRGYLMYEGSLGYDYLGFPEEVLAERIHQAIVGANDGIEVLTRSRFYDLEELLRTVELG